MEKPTINIISAGDRYNYGDVLYAVVMSEYLKKYEPEIFSDYDIRHYGIIASDLTSVGGLETLPIKDLYKKELAENSMVIVAGGQVVGANIEVLFKFLKSGKIALYTDLIRYHLMAKLGKSRGECLIRRFDCKTKFPYIISRKDMKSQCRIVYSNVGGFVSADESEAVDEIRNADYFSVRDSQSFKENSKYRQDVLLVPDAAVLMSDVFPCEHLKKEVSDQVIRVNGEYIAVQFSLSYYRQHETEIIDTLKAFKKKHKNTDIVLVPIGYAILHDDLVALKSLKAQLPEVILIEKLTVKEIMYLIAGASFFLGTSLHGIVTAMSFAVPYIALGSHNSSAKLDTFVKTWGCEPYAEAMAITKLEELYANREEHKAQLVQSAERQIALAKENYQSIFDLIK
ncbi:MAG: polysaccharide pyruvyl transferase family protein [Clostridia bacterium]|nr:polysaccharide pyruvyl transferase family protein [Clostridia bacterium]